MAQISPTPSSLVECRFGTTTVNAARREVLRDGVRINVGERAFDLLLLLIEQRGVVVSKAEIMKAVWPRRVVGENTLEGQVSLLRRALCDDRDAIRTIAGHGYQFVSDLTIDGPAVSTAAPAPSAAASAEGRAADLHRRGLPAHVSRLIGRDGQLAEVKHLIGAHRVVTLTGAGGVGKTRLAIEAARGEAGAFTDGVVLVELAGISSGDYVPAAIAGAFGFPPGDGTPDLGKLASRLCDRQCLIVVDNCEHLIDSAAQFVASLLQISPASKVLATSREPLRIDGERVHRVPSLAMPPRDEAGDAMRFGAVELFIERVGIEVQASNVPLVAGICRQLDGIPLAIELAAACTPALGLDEVAARLGDRFAILRYGARTALPRQQTLRATVDWSYALLRPDLQTALARLSVFAGNFTLESAQRLLAGAEMPRHEVASVLMELVDKSLVGTVTRLPQMHYRLLDTIRAYARERLAESGTSHDWIGRHARHVLDVFRTAEKLARDRADIDWRRTFGLYLHDLRAAIDWGFSGAGTQAIAIELVVASIAPMMQLSLIEECLRRVDLALERLPHLPAAARRSLPLPEWEMKLHAARGACLLFQNVGNDTSDAFARALALAEEAGDAEYQLRGLWGCWSHAYLNGRHPEALRLASRFSDVAIRTGWPGDRMVARRISAISQMCIGRMDNALAELARIRMPSEGASRLERIRFLYDERAMTQSLLAQSLAFLGRFDEAVHAARCALGEAQALGHAPSACYALSEAVCPTALLREDHDGLDVAAQALADVTRRHGVSTWKARAEMWRGLLALRAGVVQAYDASIVPSLEEIGHAQYCVVLAAFFSETAIALAKAGRPDDAQRLLARPLARAVATNDLFSWVELLRAKAEVRMRRSETSAGPSAEAMLLNAFYLARRHRFVAWEARCRASLARLWVSDGGTQRDPGCLPPPLVRTFQDVSALPKANQGVER
ncbi:winged helix-turn-helix domain-containing protein [Cupriavidus necator]|uniref:ATP-binding protein n=1 Tax=Cupriavidus necator TaxID=106590 RepID=UPI00339D6814